MLMFDKSIQNGAVAYHKAYCSIAQPPVAILLLCAISDVLSNMKSCFKEEPGIVRTYVFQPDSKNSHHVSDLVQC